MKTHLVSLSLRLARPALLGLPLLATPLVAQAQDANGPRILFPQPNQDVRGEITLRFENVPPDGYALIKINNQILSATSQSSYVIDTIGDRATFPDDGQYTLSISAINSTGKTLGTSTVSFNVANSKVAGDARSVRLVHWTNRDRLNDGVQRYRVWAESNADITQPQTAAGGMGGGGGMMGGPPGMMGGMGGPGMGGPGMGGAGGAGGGQQYLPAPLDWQVALLLRRQVRDVNGFDGAANIATVVANAKQHQREGSQAGGGMGGPSASSMMASTQPRRPRRGAATTTSMALVKGPWAKEWQDGPELGKFYVKSITPTGDEVNATRKATTIALADLLPTFPSVAVRPGSTWQSRQTFLSDLSTREAIDTQGAITFTSFENIQTPGGQSRRCAKLESRFPLPDSVAKSIAAKLGSKVGSAGGLGGGGMGGVAAASAPTMGGPSGASGPGGAAGNALEPEDIDVANFNIARVIWFDMDKNQVVRSEDTMTGYFEVPAAQQGAGGPGGAPGGMPGGMMMGGPPGMMGGPGGAAAMPSEPTKVNYNMNVTTWLDDRVPPPSVPFNGGAGTAHSRDNVRDVGLDRIPGAR